MSMWKEIPAEEYCDSVRDGTHDTPAQKSAGYKLVTGKHIKEGRIDPSDAYYISKEDYEVINKRSCVEKWDVLMSMIGTVGSSAVVDNDPDYAIKNVALFKCGGSELRGKWLNYFLQSPQGIGKMRGSMKGSTQQFLSLRQLREMMVLVPPRHYMKSAVEILSAYDDLIDNSRRQIKLLEEAAQRLYREWFVDMRFPGHEEVEFVDDLPVEWKNGKLDDILEQVGKPTAKSDRDAFYHYLPIDRIPAHSFSCWESDPIDRASSSLVAFNEGDIVFGAMRPYFHKVIIAPYRGLTRSTCFVLNARKKEFKQFAFMSLFFEQTIRYATSISVGTTMPYVRWEDFRKMDITIPDSSVALEFDNVTKPILRKVIVLRRQMADAAEERNRLLPKLMSGEIEV